MLKDWSNVIIPEEEEINERLEKARNKLVQQQILIMQKNCLFLCLLTDGVPREKAVFLVR